VKRLLEERYGSPTHGNPKDVFFCAIYVLLSAQTTLEQATQALRGLRRRWRTPSELSRARRKELRAVINACGFGTTRTEKILALAKEVAARPLDLRRMRAASDQELEAGLVRLPGIGFKTARVVAAMSSFGRDRFAIDTHTWRIAQRLGWIPRRATDRKPTERQADALEARIPSGSRRELHALLVALGRDSCRPQRPMCNGCCLVNICETGRVRQHH
jgi:endonuclease III